MRFQWVIKKAGTSPTFSSPTPAGGGSATSGRDRSTEFCHQSAGLRSGLCVLARLHGRGPHRNHTKTFSTTPTERFGHSTRNRHPADLVLLSTATTVETSLVIRRRTSATQWKRCTQTGRTPLPLRWSESRHAVQSTGNDTYQMADCQAGIVNPGEHRQVFDQGLRRPSFLPINVDKTGTAGDFPVWFTLSLHSSQFLDICSPIHTS